MVFFCGYAAAEAVFRASRHHELGRRPPVGIRVLDAPILKFDQDLGYRYIPNTAARLRVLDEANRVVHTNVTRINRSGHVSPREDDLEKPPREFRIAVIGDSFTACLYNEAPWPLLLEDSLNKERSLLASLDRSHFKVINFGMVATGFAQWSALYQHEVAPFRPDLVIVAFIENDLWRGFKWADTLERDADAPFQLVLVSERLPMTLTNPFALMGQMIVLSPQDAADPPRRDQLVRAAMDRRLAAMPWWSPHPEILAVLLDSAALPAPDLLRPRLSARPLGRPRWGAGTRLRGIATSMRALAAGQDTLFLHLPTEHELTREPGTPLTDVRLLHAISLSEPLRRRQALEDSSAWFIPNNGHLTQRGAQVYAQSTHGVLVAHLQSTCCTSPE